MANSTTSTEYDYDIDGGILEGGGQILRNTVAYAVLFNKNIRIQNIRASRKPPGLKKQHLTSLLLLSKYTSSNIDGLNIGSSTIICKSNTNIVLSEISIDAEGAGSISLMIQSILPCLIFGKLCKLILYGGTNASMAPSIDYMKYVLSPTLRKFGINVKIGIIKRGYFPKGGGEVHVYVDPIVELKPFICLERGELLSISFLILGYEDYFQDIKKYLKKYNVDINLHPDSIIYEPFKGNGNKPPFGKPALKFNSILIMAHFENTILAADGLDSSALSDSILAFEKLMSSNATVDEYLADQLIIFMALSNSKCSYITSDISLHTQTAIHFAEICTGCKFNINNKKIECDGIGWKNTYVK